MQMKVPKVFQNSIIYTIIMVLQKGISFFLLPLYTSFLSRSDYGVLGVVSSVSSFLSIFITLGLEAAASRFFYKNDKNEEYCKKIYGTVACVILANSLIFGSIFIAGHSWTIDHIVGEISFFPCVFIGILNVIVTPLYLLFQNYLQTRQDGLHYGINSICNFLLQVSLIVLALTVFDLGVLGVLLAQLITSTVFFIYVVICFLRKQTLGFNKPILHDCFKYSLPLLPHSIANWSNGTLDKLLVNGIRTQEDVGMYNLGQQYGSVMSFAANAVNQAYIPWFYEKVNEGKQGLKRIVQTADASICLLSLIAIVLSLFSKEVLGIMVSNPDFDGVWRIIPYIVFAYVFQAIYFFFVNVLFLKDTKIIFTITITSVIVNIALNLLLIPKFGYVGSARACLLTYFTKSVMALIISMLKNKEIRFHWVRMYFVAFIAMAIAFSSLVIESESTLLTMCVKVSILSVFSAIIIYKYKDNLIDVLKHKR